MGDLCRLIWCVVAGLLRLRAALQAEVLILRRQLNVLRRTSPKRLVFSNLDRLVFAGLCGLMPNVLDALKILKPETVIRWYCAGFRAYWRWKSPGRTRPSGDRKPRYHHLATCSRRSSSPILSNLGFRHTQGAFFRKAVVSRWFRSETCPPATCLWPRAIRPRVGDRITPWRG
jgi:hypothetical protein